MKTTIQYSNFHSPGKLLLSGEYFVLEGAWALAVPTKLGQTLKVTTLTERTGNRKILLWKSYIQQKKRWFSSTFSLQSDSFLEIFETRKNRGKTDMDIAERLKKILEAAKELNPVFLQDENCMLVEANLEFPENWGLGSSSTLINNIAQWANVNPYTLLDKTFGGSGYDIAVAKEKQSILYQKVKTGLNKEIPVFFNPPFKNNLYFVYLGQKQNSRTGIQKFYEVYKEKEDKAKACIQWISDTSKAILNCVSLEKFEILIQYHENIVSEFLTLPKVQSLYFSDYWGQTKSLGAWGGDFILASSRKNIKETFRYFKEKGFDTIVPFDEMIKNDKY